MDPKVSIIMGSTSDLPVMEKAAKVLNDFCIPFEINALSAHRTPAEVEAFAKNAQKRGIEVIIAGAGCYRRHDTNPRDRSSYQCFARRDGCSSSHRPNASGHPRCHHGNKWCHERGNTCRTNPGSRRHRAKSQNCRLQRIIEKENRRCQQRTGKSKIRLQDELILLKRTSNKWVAGCFSATHFK